MDVDSTDLDGKLLQQFSAMGTTDREVLIAEFQKLLGNTLNPDSCAFFLDMNNWNLQAAIGSYYDFEQPNVRLPSMSLVKDVTVGDGESVPPNTQFIKTWRIQNSGTETWPPGCSLRFCGGDNLGTTDWCSVDTLASGEYYDLTMEMKSPLKTGVYQGQWRMSTPTGHYFGEIIWVILTVEENGILGLTQQMARINSDERHQQPSRMPLVGTRPSESSQVSSPHNPFGGTAIHPPLVDPTQIQHTPSPAGRWLFQSSTGVAAHSDHSEDTEMS